MGCLEIRGCPTQAGFARVGENAAEPTRNLAEPSPECIVQIQQYPLILKGLAIPLNRRSMHSCAAKPAKHSVHSFAIGVGVKEQV